MLSGDDEDLLSDYFAKGIFIDSLHRLTIRSVKLYADGALGSRGAWLLKAYSDAPGKFGHNVRDMEALNKLTLSSYPGGFSSLYACHRRQRKSGGSRYVCPSL